jgi:hypothetical protein
MSLFAMAHRDQPARRTLKVASVAALSALVMDVYTLVSAPRRLRRSSPWS